MGNILIRLASLSIGKTAFFGLLLGGLLYMSPFYNDGSSLRDDLAKINAQVREQEEKEKATDIALKEVENVRTKVGNLSDQFKLVSQALPTEIQMSDIIRVVDMVSRTSGVSIKSKEPRPIRNRDFYEEIPLKITLEGSFSEITLFLYYLASKERIMKANNFSIVAPTVTDRHPSGRLVFEGQVVSYRFLGLQAGATALAPPGQEPKK